MYTRTNLTSINQAMLSTEKKKREVKTEKGKNIKVKKMGSSAGEDLDVSGLEIGLVTTEAGALTGRGSDIVRGISGRSPSATTTPSC